MNTGRPGDEVLPRVQQLNLLVLIAFGLVGGMLVFWSVVRAPAILSREDNPRLVEAAYRIRRGRILDRNGAVLAKTTGPPERLARRYPLTSAGPVVGYYSLKHGTTGIEERFDPILRGETNDSWAAFVQQLLHKPPQGRDVRLTLDASLQQAADELMAGRTGAILLFNLPRNEILALVSHPGYDPNRLDDRFEELAGDEGAPLLNRAIQGQYQPGLLLQPILLAAAVDQGLISLRDTVEKVGQPVAVNEEVTHCTTPPPERANWIDVLHHRCPGPTAALADELGISGLDQIFAGFGLTLPPTFPLTLELGEIEPIADPFLAGIGQENLTISPLQLAQALAALGTDGRVRPMQLVIEIQEEDGSWRSDTLSDDSPPRAVSAVAAHRIRAALPHHEGAAEFTVLVLSGPKGSTNAWYLGLSPATSPQVGVVIVVEESDDEDAVQEIGRQLLKLAEGRQDKPAK
ncbi:MAG: penicillin-binding transpeptidase domain-containing protein [Anaerolineae bacterium]